MINRHQPIGGEQPPGSTNGAGWVHFVGGAPRVPPSPRVFVGREAELARLAEMLARFPVGILYGVAGVGKSALAQMLANHWRGPVVYHKAGALEPLASLLDELRRQLAHGPVPEGASDEERMCEVSNQLDALRALCIIDDLHRLDPHVRQTIAVELGQSLRVGRLVLASRELLEPESGERDRFELRLAGLDEPSARKLWSLLDQLYGPGGAFEASFRLARGNPLLLRRSHAWGARADEDPISASVRGLDLDERRIAAAMALVDLRLPRELILAFLPKDRALAALDRLVARMILEIDSSGFCGMHDLYREAVLHSLSDPEASQLRQVLAEHLAVAELDPVVRVREVCRHLCALERYEKAGSYLLDQSAELIRQGAAGELLRGLESIPEHRRSPKVQVARARTLGRILDLRRAYDELRRLLTAGLQPEIEHKLSFGQLAMLTAHLEAGEGAVQEVLREPRLSLSARLRAQTALALIRTYQGRGDEARRFLDTAEVEAPNPYHAGHLSFCRAFTLWLEERDSEAEEPMRHAYALFRAGVPGFRVNVLAPAVFAALLARLGRFEEAEETLRSAESNLRQPDDVRTRLELRATRAILLHERGQRLQALAELRSIYEAYDRGGYAIGMLWMGAWVGRLLLVLGRRVEGLSLLEKTSAQASAHGVVIAQRSVERSLQEDPLRKVLADPAAPLHSKPAEVVRARAFEALRAACAADALHVHGLLEANANCAAADYGFERALGELALATLARVERRPGDVHKHLQLSQHIAVESGADPDLVPALTEALEEQLAGKRPPSGAAMASTASQASPPSTRVVLDGKQHELRCGAKVISLRRRPILRRLLYALARQPSGVATKEYLASHLWCARYNPVTHDNALLVNVSRLRSLISKSGLSIDYNGDGYFLVCPAGFEFLAPGEDLDVRGRPA